MDLEPPRLLEVAQPPEHLGTHERAREPRIGAPNRVAELAVGRSDVDGVERRIAEQGPPHRRLDDAAARAPVTVGPIAHPKRTCSPARVAHARSKRFTSSPRHVPQRTSSIEPASHRENKRERIAGQSERVLPLELQPERLAREPRALVLDLPPEPEVHRGDTADEEDQHDQRRQDLEEQRRRDRHAERREHPEPRVHAPRIGILGHRTEAVRLDPCLSGRRLAPSGPPTRLGSRRTSRSRAAGRPRRA